jgi:rubredoxin
MEPMRLRIPNTVLLQNTTQPRTLDLKKREVQREKSVNISKRSLLLILLFPTNTKKQKMFVFFIGGVKPTVQKTIQSSVQPCPSCLEGNLDLVEVANTFKAFFIPVWTFGDSRRQVLRCRQCGFLLSPNLFLESPSICASCGSTIHSGWHFCPTCGSGAAKAT